MYNRSPQPIPPVEMETLVKDIIFITAKTWNGIMKIEYISLRNEVTQIEFWILRGIKGHMMK